jgi:hypothetical protein
MKTILLFACVITLLTTTGCFFPGRGGHRWHERGELNVAPSAIVVRAPAVIVAPPLLEVRAPEVVAR